MRLTLHDIILSYCLNWHISISCTSMHQDQSQNIYFIFKYISILYFSWFEIIYHWIFQDFHIDRGIDIVFKQTYSEYMKLNLIRHIGILNAIQNIKFEAHTVNCSLVLKKITCFISLIYHYDNIRQYCVVTFCFCLVLTIFSLCWDTFWSFSWSSVIKRIKYSKDACESIDWTASYTFLIANICTV